MRRSRGRCTHVIAVVEAAGPRKGTEEAHVRHVAFRLDRRMALPPSERSHEPLGRNRTRVSMLSWHRRTAEGRPWGGSVAGGSSTDGPERVTWSRRCSSAPNSCHVGRRVRYRGHSQAFERSPASDVSRTREGDRFFDRPPFSIEKSKTREGTGFALVDADSSVHNGPSLLSLFNRTDFPFKPNLASFRNRNKVPFQRGSTPPHPRRHASFSPSLPVRTNRKSSFAVWVR